MFALRRNPLPARIEIVPAGAFPLGRTAFAHARLQRAERAGRGAPRTVEAEATTGGHVPDVVLAEAHGFLVDDRDGPVGVVDAVDPIGRDGVGTIVVACGWFGRRVLTLGFDDVAEAIPAERRLILHPDLPAIAAERRGDRSRRTLVSRARVFIARALALRARRSSRSSG